MRIPVRLSFLVAACALAAPMFAAAAPAPPKRLVCQLAKQGLVVEATFDKKSELDKDIRIFRQGPGVAQMTRIPKEEVTTFVEADGLSLGVDREIDGQTRRVFYLSWSPKATSLEVLPSAIMPKTHSGGKPIHTTGR